jgi:hypothetical protein
MAKRKLQYGEEPPPKRKECNNRYTTEIFYREALVNFCSPIYDSSTTKRNTRICSIVKYMQLDSQKEYFWSSLPHELLQYLFEQCDSMIFRNAYKIVQYDLFGRLNGGQIVCSPNGITCHGIPRLETNLLNHFTFGPNREMLRVVVKHCATRIASVFFYHVDGRNFGFEFRRNRHHDGDFFRYYHEITNFLGTQSQTCKDSEKFYCGKNINTYYNSDLAMFDEFPKFKFSREMLPSDIAWLKGQIPNLKNYFIFIVDLLKKHWEPLKHSVV